ncbi:MAG: STAS domain-containing protein [Verrucomicrobia bacterium]|nr:STAS domain-containing protein [Verrucomicrobiota bacterium]
MSGTSHLPAHQDEDVARACLSPDDNYFDLARLLNRLALHKCFRVSLDVSTVSHLGTVEFRVLRKFAESFKQQGGFLKLENASPSVAAMVRDFGLTDLLATCASHPPSDIILPKNREGRDR